MSWTHMYIRSLAMFVGVYHVLVCIGHTPLKGSVKILLGYSVLGMYVHTVKTGY